MQDGQRPVGVGLSSRSVIRPSSFALTIVVAISAGLISDIPAAQQIGGLIGTAVSGTFLIIIGIINLVVLIDIYRMFRKVSAGGEYDEESLEDFLNNRGLLARILRPMMKIVRKSWHMYPLGVLFGLGFDTASEVALSGSRPHPGPADLPIPLNPPAAGHLRRRDVHDRLDGRHPDARCLRLGLCQTGSASSTTTLQKHPPWSR